MLKLRRSSKLILLILLFTLSALFLLPRGVVAETVSLHSGKFFYVKNIRTLMTNSLQMGDVIDLVVAEDVMVKGKTIIKSGAHATGTVIKASKKGILGKAGELSIQLDTVKAVDGTIVYLSGGRTVSGKDNSMVALSLGVLLCPLFSLMNGEEAFIQANNRIQALVVGTYNIDVN